jgi:hypothetical protein
MFAATKVFMCKVETGKKLKNLLIAQEQLCIFA